MEIDNLNTILQAYAKLVLKNGKVIAYHNNGDLHELASRYPNCEIKTVPKGTIINEDSSYELPEMTPQEQWEWEMKVSDEEEMSREIEDLWDAIIALGGKVPSIVKTKHERKKTLRNKKPERKR